MKNIAKQNMDVMKKIRAKKNPNAIERFLISCEKSKSLSRNLESAQKAILAHLSQAEEFRLKQQEALKKAEESYIKMTLGKDFAESLERMVAEQHQPYEEMFRDLNIKPE